MATRKMKVVEVSVNGKALYLTGKLAGIGGSGATTDDAMKAKDYSLLPGIELERDLKMTIAPGDASWPMSGLKVDALPQVVEFEVELREALRYEGRALVGGAKSSPPKP